MGEIRDQGAARVRCSLKGRLSPWGVDQRGQGTPVDSTFLKFQAFLWPSDQGSTTS